MGRFFLRRFLCLGTRFSFIVMMTLGASGMARATECQYCQGKSPAELADISVNSGSGSLRSQLRAYLAENFPDTGYGMFGKAWIESANDSPKEEVIALYKKAVALEPDFIAARVNLGFEQENAGQNDAAISTYRQALSLRSPDPIFVRNLFFWIKDQDPNAALAFLDEAEKGEYTAYFGVDYVRGLDAKFEGDRESADGYFQRALDNGGTFEVLEALVSNRLAFLSGQRASRDELLDVIRYALRWSETNNDAQGIKLVADKLYSEFESRDQAVSFYRTSYDLFPTPETATEAFGVNANNDFDNLYDFLLSAERDFPDNHKVLKTLAWANYNFRLDPERAREYGTRAIAAASRFRELRISVNDLAGFYNEVGEYSATRKLYETNLVKVSGRAARNLLGGYIDSRIAASDFADAARLLAKAEADQKFSKNWIAIRRNRIDSALRLQASRDRFFEQNPFLQQWEREFGESLRVTVEFATGKSDIRPEAFPVIEKAAQALRVPGAEDYVFLIEGHSDSVGTDAVNIPLSKARAAAVETYLVDKLGLDRARIQTMGFGPRNPLAPNDTDVGRQDNRRVEIRPYGNITKPNIAVNGALNAKNLRLSGDGRVAVTGSGPLEVWDLQRMVRLHELSRGLGGEISPNGRYYAVGSSFTDTAGKTFKFLIYDLRTGHIVSQLHLDTDVDEISWSPFSKEVAWTDRNGYLKVMKVGETRPDRVGRIGTLRGSQEMIWLKDGRHIVASMVQDPRLAVFDAKTLDVTRYVDDAGWVHGIGQSNDGSRLVIVNNSRQMVIWNTANWEVVAARNVPSIPRRIVSHPSKPWVLMNDAFDSSVNLTLVDLSTGKTLRETSAPQDLSINFTPDGTQFVANPDGIITYYNTETLSPVRSVNGLSDRGREIEIIPQRDLVISRDDGSSHVWSLKTGRRVHALTTETELGWSDLSGDGKKIMTVDPQGRIIVFSTEDFTETVAFETGLSIDHFRVSENYVVLSGMNGTEGPMDPPLGELIILNRSNLKVVSRISADIVTEPLSYGDVYRPGFSDVTISEEKGEVAIATWWQDGYGQNRTKTKIVRTYALDTGQERAGFQVKERIRNLKYENHGQELWVQGGSQWFVYDPASGKKLATKSPKTGFEIELSGGRVLYWLYDFVRLDGKEVYFPGSLRDLEVFEERNLAIGITTGNEIVFINLEQMRSELTIVPKRSGEWIAYTPDGGYSASLNGTEGVFWSLGDNYLNFEALKSQFERPDLIRKRLEAMANRDTLPDQNPDVNVEVFEAPYKVTLVSKKTSNTDADTYLLELQVIKDNVNLPDPEIEYILNGRRVLKSRGFDEEAVFEGTETLGISRRFDLKPGRNTIEASLIWRDARLATQRVEVTRKVSEPENVQVSQNTLWFFGVGVSDYEIATQNLNFAHRDAQELAKTLKAQEGVLFKKVNTHILTNEDATERQVRIDMNEFLDQAAPEDVIVLFIAGHGVTNAEQELFFITHDADIKRPFTGMAVDRFRSYLDNRPINQKALFLLDICHSGAVDGRVVAEDAVQVLTKGTGAVVFASSSGSQLSFEDETFGGGHGAFTAAFLEGLRGVADSKVGDRDGFNSIQEMIIFTSSRVPEMTEGQQRPSFPTLASNTDFLLSQSQN